MAATTDLAHQDELTGAYNRRFLSLLFGERWRELMALHGKLSLIIVDLDEFKAVNDSHGHLTGDDVLKATAQILREHFRQSDLLIRYGGDEFIILAPNVDAAEAAQLAERARTAGAALTVPSRKNGHPLAGGVAFSIGVATCPDDGQTGEELIAAADRRLYDDKSARRRQSRRPVSPIFVIGATIVGLALLFTSISRLGDQPVRQPPATPTPVTAALAQADEEAERLRSLLMQAQAEIQALRAEQAAAEAAAKRLTDERLLLEEEPPRPPAGAARLPTPSPDPRMAELSETVRALEEKLRLRAEAPRTTDSPTSDPRATPTVTPTPVLSGETPPLAAPPVITPPELLSQGTPVYPRMAKSMRKSATVRIRVIVDARGRVIDAQPIGEPAGFGFEEAAIQAARKSKFRPGTRDGVALQSDYILTYGFTLE